MESWQFIQSPAGGWYWLCSDVLSRRTRTSAATFPTRNECVADAITCGYQNGVPTGAQAITKNAPPRKQGEQRRRGRSKAGKHKRT